MPIQIGKSPLELSPTLSKRNRKRSAHEPLQNSPKQIKLDYTEADKDSEKSIPEKTLNEPIPNKEPLKNSSKQIKSNDTEAKKDAKKCQPKETLNEAKTKSKESEKLPAKKMSIAKKSDKNAAKIIPSKIPGRKAEVVKVKTTVNSTKKNLPKLDKPTASKFFKSKIGKTAPVKSIGEPLKNLPKQTKLDKDKENKKPKLPPPKKLSNSKKMATIEDDLPTHSTM